MLFLLTYDIDTSEDKGKRLQKVSKICESYGERVQNSVFEINTDMTKMKEFELKLSHIIDKDADSIRIYKLGKYLKYDVLIIGTKQSVELSEAGGLIF